jgi:mono/diheme cytochrome c family protein
MAAAKKCLRSRNLAMLRCRWEISFAVAAMLVVSAAIGFAADGQPTAEDLRFFETNVRPVLANHCYKCHGAEKQESDLRLDTFGGMMTGGAAGPAIVSGEPAKSLLVSAIGYQDKDLRMPPDKKLTDRQIADITRWVKLGAPHPNADGISPQPLAKIDIEKGRQFWAFRPPVDPSIPSVLDKSWPTSPLDHFILAQSESNGLAPAPPADKRTLIRRATFDLTGLPPTPAEIVAFLMDDSPLAFAKVVDRLLDSPHYGERWGRHWLDVARYADSNGLDENIAHGNAWRYRDYVIAALNDDKPYNQFLVEQLAGDLLPPTDNLAIRHERLIATGFLSLGPKVLAEVDETKMEMDIVDEQIDTVGRALMGLTLGCARCHDHKFDPLPTEDYYALAGIFKSTRTMEHFKKIARWYENSLATDDDLASKSAYEKKVAEKKNEVQQVVEAANERLKAASEKAATLPKDAESLYPEETKAELKRLRDELAQLEKSAPLMSTAMGVTEGNVADVAVHVRGSHLTLGNVVPRHVPQVLCATGSASAPFETAHSGRLQLAQWLIDEKHPLTSRVMVNRIWRWHFGEGLVRSTDNFGKLGERPVNPPLLDWLALRFIDSGWSIKSMHRLMMLSSTYRMSSRFDDRAAQIDPENRLQWRANVRRLEAEAIRDSLLAVSGTLDRTMGGSLLHVPNREFLFNHTSQDHTKYDSLRRSIYLPVIRNHLYDVFQLFDYSEASVSTSSRTTSTVAPQALFMLNSDFMQQSAKSLAAELLSHDADDAARIRLLYLKTYGRPPSENEVARARSLVEKVEQSFEDGELSDEPRQLRAWSLLCQVIVAANEFVYIK